MSFTIMLVVGRYGGFRVTPTRLCLGWIALTLLPGIDIEMHLESLVEKEQQYREALRGAECTCRPHAVLSSDGGRSTYECLRCMALGMERK
jgi:hypothetical protein